MLRRQNSFLFLSDDDPQVISTPDEYWDGKTSRVYTDGLNLNVSITSDGVNEHKNPIVPGLVLILSNTSDESTNAVAKVFPDPQDDDSSDFISILPGESLSLVYLGFEKRFSVLGQSMFSV